MLRDRFFTIREGSYNTERERAKINPMVVSIKRDTEINADVNMCIYVQCV